MAVGVYYESAQLSVADYLAAERIAVEKHEFLNGEIRVMPGARKEHLRVTPQLSAFFTNSFADGLREYLDSDVKVWIPDKRIFTYPDGAIACPPEWSDQDTTGILLNPKVIFEVLSPSTEAYDRGGKFRNYRSLPTLQDYVLIDTTMPVVEVFSGPNWSIATYEGLDAVAHIPSVSLDLPLRIVYRKTFAASNP
ncbi:Uma2 family endonuclease [bacterium]|nr:MAG: Uma2 family endonuclease [bacterium]